MRAKVPLEPESVPVDDWQSDAAFALRQAAYAAGDGGVPALWTPEIVQARLISAFDSLARLSSSRVGPAQRLGYWPDVLQDKVPLIEKPMHAAHRLRVLSRSRAQMTAYELALMDEALTWPLRYLQDRPLQADAISLYSSCKALDLEIEPMLRERRQRANRLIEEARTDDAARNPGKLQRRKAIAKALAAEINKDLAAVTTEDERNKLRKAAELHLLVRCREDGCLPFTMAPHEAMPGKILNWARLDKHRRAAGMTIARSLNRAKVVVRLLVSDAGPNPPQARA